MTTIHLNNYTSLTISKSENKENELILNFEVKGNNKVYQSSCKFEDILDIFKDEISIEEFFVHVNAKNITFRAIEDENNKKKLEIRAEKTFDDLFLEEIKNPQENNEAPIVKIDFSKPLEIKINDNEKLIVKNRK